MSNALHKTQNSFRKRLVLALAPVVAIASLSAPALAQAQNAEAERLNTAGKEHFKERRYLDAYKNFKQATAVSPEGRFFFNLCFSLNYLERFQEAIEACEQVEPNGADAKLRDKTNAVLKALRAQVPAQPTNPNTNPGDPNTNPTDPNTNPSDPNTNPTDPNTNPTNPNTNPNTNPPPPRGPVQVPGLDPFAEKEAATSD
ncbi:MAG: hypothetical protein JKY56_21425 [Kofleriaceae bacterium]|nr:hypothetical protein [Kofleriaceae bacterium]